MGAFAKIGDYFGLCRPKTILDSLFPRVYNPSHSEVVRVRWSSAKVSRPRDLIEKDVPGGSIRRETTPKSSDECAEEIHVKVERHGIARYSKDRCWSVTECAA